MKNNSHFLHSLLKLLLFLPRGFDYVQLLLYAITILGNHFRETNYLDEKF